MNPRKMVALLALASALAASAVAYPASAQSPVFGLTSEHVEHVAFVPFEVASATGARIVGKYFYLTSWKNISIYDISDPENPQMVSITPIGFQFESEDVATNGKILLFSETLPGTSLHVWDVTDKANPVEIGTLAGAGNHTSTCILKCTYSYGSEGMITDLRDPANPKAAGNWVTAAQVADSHDVVEVAPGFVLTASSASVLLDVRNPVKPKVLAREPPSEHNPAHSARWPHNMKDRFILGQSETNASPQCGAGNGSFSTWETTDWQTTEQYTLIDNWTLYNGTYTDGAPPANAGLGCSAHWFREHKTFSNGGLVAMGAYEHGTRFFCVDKDGMITEVGWFLPWGGSTSGAYWLTDELVYSVDYTRGIDILRWTGDIPVTPEPDQCESMAVS